ncbi:ABC transporter substrate-binding protein [Ochrobactrum sp. GPK 3]|uniref:hypothetical protein n=1 Tax=Brucella sp. 22210 TaxID=3453892 RepID=UPI0031385F91
MKSSSFRHFAVMAGIIGLVALKGTSASAEVPLSQKVQSLRDAAKEEASVSIFVSTDPRTRSDEEKLEKQIEADLGVKIRVSLVSGAPDPVYIQQLIQQHNAGVQSPVDIVVTVPPLLNVMKGGGVIAPTDWASLDANPEDTNTDIHGLFVAEFSRPVIYNTNLLKPDEIPKNLDELLSSKWKGRIVTAALPDIFLPWATGLGRDATLNMVKTMFNDLKVGVAPAPTAIRTLVESGEYPIGFGIRISTSQITNGSPVAYAPIKSPLVPRFAVVTESSSHKNSAMLVAWWLSQTENGQKLSAEVLDWPRHTTPGTDLFQMAKMTDGFYSAPASWWTSEGVEIGKAVAQLLRTF